MVDGHSHQLISLDKISVYALNLQTVQWGVGFCRSVQCILDHPSADGCLVLWWLVVWNAMGYPHAWCQDSWNERKDIVWIRKDWQPKEHSAKSWGLHWDSFLLMKDILHPYIFYDYTYSNYIVYVYTYSYDIICIHIIYIYVVIDAFKKVASRLLLDYFKLGAISLSLGEVAMVGEWLVSGSWCCIRPSFRKSLQMGMDQIAYQFLGQILWFQASIFGSTILNHSQMFLYSTSWSVSESFSQNRYWLRRI